MNGDRNRSPDQDPVNDDECRKYLVIGKSDKQVSGYTVSIHSDVVEKSLEMAGRVVLISTDINDAKRTLSIFLDEDVVEKGFLHLQTVLILGNYVSTVAMPPRETFFGFIASVIMSGIKQLLSDKVLYGK